MVLILLSTIPPSTYSPLSPRSHLSSTSSSPFFAILSPLFDHNGPEDDQPLSAEAAPAPSAEPAHAAHASIGAASAFSASSLSPSSHTTHAHAFTSRPRAVPSLMPAPLRARPLKDAAHRIDKVLPPTPHSPAHPSPLQHAHTFNCGETRSSEFSDAAAAAAAAARSRLRSVPAVHVSTVAEVIDADGSHVVRTLSNTEKDRLAHTPPPSALYAARPPLPPRPGLDAAAASVAMSGIDLDIPSPCTPFSPRTPAETSPLPQFSLRPSTPRCRGLPSPFSPSYSPLAGPFEMDVPLAIEPLLLPPSPVSPPAAPLLGPAPVRKHRKAASATNLGSLKRNAIFKPFHCERELACV